MKAAFIGPSRRQTKKAALPKESGFEENGDM
jgi:hypothetical protein